MSGLPILPAALSRGVTCQAISVELRALSQTEREEEFLQPFSRREGDCLYTPLDDDPVFVLERHEVGDGAQRRELQKGLAIFGGESGFALGEGDEGCPETVYLACFCRGIPGKARRGLQFSQAFYRRTGGKSAATSSAIS